VARSILPFSTLQCPDCHKIAKLHTQGQPANEGGRAIFPTFNAIQRKRPNGAVTLLPKRFLWHPHLLLPRPTRVALASRMSTPPATPPPPGLPLPTCPSKANSQRADFVFARKCSTYQL